MWHIDAEIIALVFMLVISADVFKTNTITSLKDKLFNILAITTIFAILSDIISSLAMVNYQTTSWWIIQISLLAYFILTPFLSMLWQLYAIAVVSKESTIRKRNCLITVVPFLVFVAIAISNPYTGWLFQLTAANEYARGVFFNSMFVVFFGYSLATLVLAVVNLKKVERTTTIVLSMFPFIVGISVLLQQMLTGYLLVGSAFTLVLLITYMFLQNRKATRDNLTGINNRAAFTTAIEGVSKGNSHGFVLVIAADDFKLFNQTFGQAKGDLLLCQMAEYLVSVSPSKMAYRYGGDIFTLMLKKANNQEALGLANQIMERFSKPFYMENIAYSISICLGIVEYPDNSIDKNHSIISAMDFAIYQAKKRGKGQIAFFNEDLVLQLKRKHDIVSALNAAIENKSFQVYLQPIYDKEKQKFIFGEALLRLDDEYLGTISPCEFVPIAEETGQIVEITYFVLAKVCEFLSQNRKVLKDEVAISVNFSVIQFMQTNMVERVKAIIESYQIPPQLIKIEITETVIADSFDAIKKAMDSLNEYGISFALDDYGQGYSNISYLINLPFSVVKLDKSIIDNITVDENFISALIPMFKKLNKMIVSEGVETEEQVKILDKLTCDAIQGFYFAKPMPMDEALVVFQK